jgi:CubicO group peptidase (beta-lactamase class C family)
MDHLRAMRLVMCIGWLGAWLMHAKAQDLRAFADSLRTVHGVPELGYAVVRADGVLRSEVLGIKQAGTDRPAERTDHFRIGSNTKVVTAYLARQWVERGVLAWDTRLFELVPELQAGSHRAHHDITLLDLLDFRARFLPWTYSDTLPAPATFTGDVAAQRVQLLQWAVQRAPVPKGDGYHFSNLSYVAAGLMLERATGRSYTELVHALGAATGIDLRFGTPNVSDPTDTWGHHADGTPEAPAPNVKLDWLLAAGGISMSLPEHAAFIRMELKRIADLLPRPAPPDLALIRRERPTLALAWRWTEEEDGMLHLYHVGNPGTFLTQVHLHPYADRAYLLYANQQSEEADAALDALYEELIRALH